jgi:hypothetical protein
MLHVHVYVIVLRYVILNHHMQAVQPTIVQLRFTRNSPCHADRLLSTRPYTCQYQQSRRTGPTSVSLVPDNCAPLNHWSYHVGHWLHRHIIHWFMASNCSKIKCPCCIMDTPLAPSPLKPTPPFIQTLLVVHCQQTCGKEIRAGEYSTHKCAEKPRPSDADVQTACHTVTGFHQLSTDRLREKGAESIHTKLTSCNVRTIRYMTQLEDCP